MTLLLALVSLSAEANEPPSARLLGATVPRAKALSLDAALLRGWQLRGSGRDYAVFETLLDEPASTGPPDAARSEQTHLRIRAAYSARDDGVEVSLRAEEVWRAGTPRAWMVEITDLYRDRLERALQSLRSQWQALRATESPSAGEGPAARMLGQGDDSVAAPGACRHLGLWAFDAEQLARTRGCQLDDRGAVLLSATPTVEQHQVGCLNRAPMPILCDRLRCWLER